MFPTVSVEDLRTRLDVGPEVVDDPKLQHCLDVAAAVINPRVDDTRLPAADAAYIEGLLQLACKVWDTSNRGMVTLDVDAGPDYTAFASPGFYRSVLGVLSPCLYRSGVIIG